MGSDRDLELKLLGASKSQLVKSMVRLAKEIADLKKNNEHLRNGIKEAFKFLNSENRQYVTLPEVAWRDKYRFEVDWDKYRFEADYDRRV